MALLLLVAGCATTPPVLQADPKTFPCGAFGVVCTVPEKGCCNENEVCGNDPHLDPEKSCPVGTCCEVGEEDLGAKRLRPSHPMRTRP